jgi:hypothetical protein
MRKAQRRKSPECRELHHVFPVSIYGKNKKVVALTPREHYVAHALLYLVFRQRCGRRSAKTIKMLAAATLLGKANFNGETRRVNSRLYESIRIELASAQRELNSGTGNPNYGKKHSMETRRRISEGLTGLKHSADSRRRMGDSKRGRSWFHKGEISVKSEVCPEGFKPGRPDSLGAKLSESKKGRAMPAAERSACRDRMIGDKNHQFGKRGAESANYGRKRSEETRGKIREANLGRVFSDEHKMNISKSRTAEKSHCWGKHWYNNGVTELLAVDCPDGFKKGRIQRLGRAVAPQGGESK